MPGLDPVAPFEPLLDDERLRLVADTIERCALVAEKRAALHNANARIYNPPDPRIRDAMECAAVATAIRALAAVSPNDAPPGEPTDG